MTVFDYALLWAVVIGLACLTDQAWMRWLRPRLERRFGWPPLSLDEKIPAYAWGGGFGAVYILVVVLPTMGVAAGY